MSIRTERGSSCKAGAGDASATQEGDGFHPPGHQPSAPSSFRYVFCVFMTVRCHAQSEAVKSAR